MGEGNIDYVAWWGAGLSTLLAIVKLWELWKDRFRIDIGHGFAGDSTVGNDIHIRNLSGTPIILEYWEVFYRPNIWPIKKDTNISSPEDEAYDLKIDPHSSYTLHFSGDDHFDWGWKVMKGRKICIRLHIAGRKPIVKKVFG